MPSPKKFLHKLILRQDFSAPYYDRESRYQFAAKMFGNYLRESVLDVGSSHNYLKNYILTDTKYVSVDIVGKPTYNIDLEKDALSQFEDNSFTTVICCDVLEHLDNLHQVFDEICRVSNQFVIISLPNNWLHFKFRLIKSKGESKFYGLPLEEPIDRHKWFFNYDQALNFLIERGKINNFEYKLHIPLPFIQFRLKHRILHLFFKLYYNNQFGLNNANYSNVWVLLEKRDFQ